MKNISELVNDREACERIFRFFFGKRVLKEISLFESNGKKQVLLVTPGKLYGMRTGVKIRENGSVSQSHEREYNPFAFVALMNELGYGPENETNPKIAKVLAVESGGDWADASVDYLVNISGRSGEELIEEYRASGGYSGNGRRFFRQWVIESDYCREPNDDEVEVVSDSI